MARAKIERYMTKTQTVVTYCLIGSLTTIYLLNLRALLEFRLSLSQTISLKV